MTVRKYLLLIMISMLTLPTITVSAEENQPAKNEVVYTILQPDGSQKEMYVVNSFEEVGNGEITDYGAYTDVKNLTDLSEINLNGDKVSLAAEQDNFFYQGNLEEQPLPWNFEIDYQLNGQDKDPEQMLGEDGRLRIEIKTSANSEIDSVFYENYLLQISLTFDGEHYQDVKAEDGTIANAGKNKQVTFTVMPEQDGHLVAEAQVKDYEQGPIEISAVPAFMAIDSPDLEDAKDEFRTLSDALAELASGAEDLQQGMSELNGGISELADGSSEFNDGMHEINNGSSDLVNGSSAIQEALQTMNESLQQQMNFDDLDELRSGLQELAAGLREASNGISDFDQNYFQAFDLLEEAMQEIPAYQITEADIANLRESDIDQELVESLLETYYMAQEAKTVYEDVQTEIETIIPTIEGIQEAQAEVITTLETMADQLETASEQLDLESSFQPLQDGVAALAEEYQGFHEGLVSYTDGVGQLTNSYESLHQGISELPEGAAALASGAGELSDGASQLSEATSDLPDQLQNQVDDMINEFDKSDFDPVSFVSDKNENVELVQFVIQTDAVEKETTEEEAEEPEEEKGWWEKLIDLFR
ncbi:YhgE/Pip domain-containing protein [Gracilibacillus alcaliphilus]|uniref:YhgE/Pip domain-containing protein n=1 Tax=Gracilibacillus alcaliphilus TaxID=1401441 RepID=UPI00195AA3B0|nr:YhgE/Pip domain-containing protein [Gracilibacillus alcaliphilus]MBM7675531.1 X-X-X-Leu-X-X-Gly heptad repeat protein [Gracilibacillus alcaliphilus]